MFVNIVCNMSVRVLINNIGQVYIYIYIYIYIYGNPKKSYLKKIGHVHNDTRRHFQALAHLCFTISLTV